MALSHTFAKLFNVWLNRRQLDFHICFHFSVCCSYSTNRVSFQKTPISNNERIRVKGSIATAPPSDTREGMFVPCVLYVSLLPPDFKLSSAYSNFPCVLATRKHQNKRLVKPSFYTCSFLPGNQVNNYPGRYL